MNIGLLQAPSDAGLLACANRRLFSTYTSLGSFARACDYLSRLTFGCQIIDTSCNVLSELELKKKLFNSTELLRHYFLVCLRVFCSLNIVRPFCVKTLNKMQAVEDCAWNNGCQSGELDLERDGDKITGRSKKRFPFLFAIPRSQSLMRLVRELTVVLPPAKMSISSVVFCSFVKVLLLFYNGTLN